MDRLPRDSKKTCSWRWGPCIPGQAISTEQLRLAAALRERLEACAACCQCVKGHCYCCLPACLLPSQQRNANNSWTQTIEQPITAACPEKEESKSKSCSLRSPSFRAKCRRKCRGAHAIQASLPCTGPCLQQSVEAWHRARNHGTTLL